ncbi:MAG: plastocyanin/azurin family copper-binding protein [Verrucomicrobiales bacterium]
MKQLTRSIFIAAALAVPASAIIAEDTEITLTADKVQFAYDKKEFTVKAGAKVKLTLHNPTGAIQPHNIIIVKPGKKDAVGMIANQSMADPNFLKNPVPKSEDVLFSSKLAQPGTKEVIEFTAPSEPGEYPYLCTFPGHWIIMNGIMKVEK